MRSIAFIVLLGASLGACGNKKTDCACTIILAGNSTIFGCGEVACVNYEAFLCDEDGVIETGTCVADGGADLAACLLGSASNSSVCPKCQPPNNEPCVELNGTTCAYGETDCTCEMTSWVCYPGLDY
jgi:hypothetical protein